MLRLPFACLLLLATAHMGCDLSNSDSDDLIEFELDMLNNSSEAVHMLVEDEPFGPGNRVQPDGVRTVVVSRLADGPEAPEDPYLIRVGRNGVVDVFTGCRRTTASGERAEVVYTDTSPFLACVNW